MSKFIFLRESIYTERVEIEANSYDDAVAMCLRGEGKSERSNDDTVVDVDFLREAK